MNDSQFLSLVWTQLIQVSVLIAVVWLLIKLFARKRPHLAYALWLLVLVKCLTPPVMSSPTGVLSQVPVPEVPWARLLVQEEQEVLHAVVEPEPELPELPEPWEPEPEILELEGVIVDDLSRGFVVDEADLPPEFFLEEPLISEGAQEVELVEATPPVEVAEPEPPAKPAAPVSHRLWTFWCASAGFVLLVTFARVLITLRRVCRNRVAVPAELEDLVTQLSRKLKLRRKVRILVTAAKVGPAVVGFFRPLLILPQVVTEGRSAHELEPIIAHELLHVKRGDLGIGWLQVLVQSLWWFHPLVWLVNRFLSREAERCCDEAVVAELDCAPATYARCLLNVLEQKRNLTPIPACPGVKPVELTKQRMERIMKLGQGCRKRSPWWCWLIVVLLGVVVLPGRRENQAEANQATLIFQLQEADAAQVTTEIERESIDTAESSAKIVTRTYSIEDVVQRMCKDHELTEQAAQIHLEMLIGNSMTSFESRHGLQASPPLLTKCFVNENTLIVRGLEERHETVTGLLKLWEQVGLYQIKVSTKYATTRLQVSAKNVAGKHNANSALTARLTEQEELQLINTLQGEPHTNVLFAPNVTLFNGQRAVVFDEVYRPFVTGMKADGPVIDVLPDGWKFVVTPTVAADGRIQLDYEIHLAEISDVDTEELPGRNGKEPATVQVPQTRQVHLRSEAKLQDGETLLVSGLNEHMKDGDDPENFLVMITPTLEKVDLENLSWESMAVNVSQSNKDGGTVLSIKINKALDSPVELDFQQAKLTDVLKQISKEAGISVLLDSDLPEGIKRFTPVDFQSDRSTTLKQDLAAICEPIGLTLVVEDEVLRITGKENDQLDFITVGFPVGGLVKLDAQGKPDFRPLIELLQQHPAHQRWNDEKQVRFIPDESKMALWIRHRRFIIDMYAKSIERVRRRTAQAFAYGEAQEFDPFGPKPFDPFGAGVNSDAGVTGSIVIEDLKFDPPLEMISEHQFLPKNKFDRIISSEFENVSLKSAIKQICEAGDLEVDYDADELAEEGISPEAPVSFAARDVVAIEALSEMLEPFELELIIEAKSFENLSEVPSIKVTQVGKIAIRPTSVLERRPILVTYPVADLIMVARDKQEKPDIAQIGDSLADSLKTAMKWQVTDETVPKGQISFSEPNLAVVVRCVRFQHETIAKLLCERRKACGLEAHPVLSEDEQHLPAGPVKNETARTFPNPVAADEIDTVQVRFLKPNHVPAKLLALKIGASDRATNPREIRLPGRIDLPPGKVYLLYLTEPLTRSPEFYWTLEIPEWTDRTKAYLARNSILAQFTEADFEQVSANNVVTKVIYLQSPEYSSGPLEVAETLVSTRLAPGIDPIEEAKRRGTILAVLRSHCGKLMSGTGVNSDAGVVGQIVYEEKSDDNRVDPALWKILVEWEEASRRYKRLACNHKRFVYDSIFRVAIRSEGNLYYEAPDKWRIDSEPVKIDPGEQSRKRSPQGKRFSLKSDVPEIWIRNGKQIAQAKESPQKLYTVYNIPEKVRAGSFADFMTRLSAFGPAGEFLYGLSAKDAVERYDFSLLPDTDEHRIWIEVHPKLEEDAGNWQQCQVILDRKTFLPFAIKMLDPAGATETVYRFENFKVNEQADQGPFNISQALKDYKLVELSKSVNSFLGTAKDKQSNNELETQAEALSATEVKAKDWKDLVVAEEKPIPEPPPEQSERLVTLSYPVADLVVPVPGVGVVPVEQEAPSSRWGIPVTGTPISIPGPARISAPDAASGAATEKKSTSEKDAADPPSPYRTNAGILPVPTEDGPEEKQNSVAENLKSLSELIKKSVHAEEGWHPEGKASLMVRESTISLVIRAGRSTHDQIREVLEDLRRKQDLQVTLDCHVVALTEEESRVIWERIGIDYDFENPASDRVKDETVCLLERSPSCVL